MPKIRIILFGGFAAYGPGGSPLALPTRKAEAVLALLACRPGEAQPRERVAALLWGERSDRQARHSLSQTLSSIRSAMADAPELFLSERESLAINPDVVDADVIDFVGLAARNDVDSLRKAADLYRGPLLEGF